MLGGTRFLGRAVVTEALAAGWGVTTLTRGVGSQPPTFTPEKEARVLAAERPG